VCACVCVCVCVCVCLSECVCVCVCVCERERERVSERECVHVQLSLSVSLCLCVNISLSLSLSLFVPVRVCACTCVHMCSICACVPRDIAHASVRFCAFLKKSVRRRTYKFSSTVKIKKYIQAFIHNLHIYNLHSTVSDSAATSAACVSRIMSSCSSVCVCRASASACCCSTVAMCADSKCCWRIHMRESKTPYMCVPKPKKRSVCVCHKDPAYHRDPIMCVAQRPCMCVSHGLYISQGP